MQAANTCLASERQHHRASHAGLNLLEESDLKT